MPDYLFINADDLESIDTDLCYRVSAASEREARRFVMEMEANDAAFIEYLGNKSLDSGLVSKFYLKTEREIEAMQQRGEAIASVAVVRSRIRAFFKEHTSWSDIMCAYVEGEQTFTDEELRQYMPFDMRVYLASHMPDWRTYTLINLDKTRRLA
jgi:hypothetical protein